MGIRSNSRSAAGAALACGLALLGAAGPASAGAVQDRSEWPLAPAFLVFDDDLNGVVFINADRGQLCTDEVLAWEQRGFEWRAAGNKDPFPEPPPAAAQGIDMVRFHGVDLPPAPDRGVLVHQETASGLPSQLWTFHDGIDGPEDLRGPCLDTEGGEFVASGTGSVRIRDNDYLGSGSRGNAWTLTATAKLADERDGSLWRYNQTIHSVNNGTGDRVIDRFTQTLDHVAR